MKNFSYFCDVNNPFKSMNEIGIIRAIKCECRNVLVFLMMLSSVCSVFLQNRIIKGMVVDDGDPRE